MALVDAEQNLVPVLHATVSNDVVVAGSMPHSGTTTSRVAKRARTTGGGGARKWRRPSPAGGRPRAPDGRRRRTRPTSRRRARCVTATGSWVGGVASDTAAAGRPVERAGSLDRHHRDRRTGEWSSGHFEPFHTPPYGDPSVRYAYGYDKGKRESLLPLTGPGPPSSVGSWRAPAVAVEPLAKELGATKGSFYWHFADRNGCSRRRSSCGNDATPSR